MDILACSLRNLKIDNHYDPIYIEKGNNGLGFFLVYKDQCVKNIINSSLYKYQYGQDEVNKVKNNVLCYLHFDDLKLEEIKRRALVNNIFTAAHVFSNALWFVKDNAVTPHMATMSTDEFGKYSPIGLRRNLYVSNSKGEYEIMNFTKKEIVSATRWIEKLEGFNSTKDMTGERFWENELQNMSVLLNFNIPSFDRAYYFLQSTRRLDFLPAKIAGYISILETLFVIKGDNRKKASERTAALIGVDNDEKIKLKSTVTKAYDIRSDYIHGSLINEGTNELISVLSYEIDEIVRRVFKELILNRSDLNNEAKSNKRVNREFQKMVDTMNADFNS
ncbi:hypothetical protein VXN63_02145 [Marinilactibacillus sp. XAAS-LB27]|uniref:hypothetical protein n=1 Tax=Marinilactibacillus sp. XAAS-LB27 TaxID=3114538 RepID=UPI002E17A3AA|nr:hypothetical protein [Marinilactibacillus sp. XAAS-LB27]